MISSPSSSLFLSAISQIYSNFHYTTFQYLFPATMHSKTYLLILSFLSIYLLSLASAYPHSVRAVLVGVTGTTGSRAPVTAQTSGKTKQHEDNDEGEPENEGHDPPNDHTEDSSSTESSTEDKSDDSSPDCQNPNPLPLQFTQQFKDGQGHGCKKIAKAFDTCSSHQGFFCENLNSQGGCLCAGHPSFDQNLADCVDFLGEQRHEKMVERLVGYEGVCAM